MFRSVISTNPRSKLFLLHPLPKNVFSSTTLSSPKMFCRSLSANSDISDGSETSKTCSITQIIDIATFKSRRQTSYSNTPSFNPDNFNYRVPINKRKVKLNPNILPPEKPTACCNEECKSCLWILYLHEVIHNYNGDPQKIDEAFDSIPNEKIRDFVRNEVDTFFQTKNYYTQDD